MPQRCRAAAVHPAIHGPTGTEAYPGTEAWVSGLPGEELDAGDLDACAAVAPSVTRTFQPFASASLSTTRRPKPVPASAVEQPASKTSPRSSSGTPRTDMYRPVGGSTDGRVGRLLPAAPGKFGGDDRLRFPTRSPSRASVRRYSMRRSSGHMRGDGVAVLAVAHLARQFRSSPATFSGF